MQVGTRSCRCFVAVLLGRTHDLPEVFELLCFVEVSCEAAVRDAALERAEVDVDVLENVVEVDEVGELPNDEFGGVPQLCAANPVPFVGRLLAPRRSLLHLPQVVLVQVRLRTQSCRLIFEL